MKRKFKWMRSAAAKRRLQKRVEGMISLMLVIIMMPTMLLSGLMVDLARFSMGKTMISSAGDLTMNAALADYDTIVKEVYGLFAISQDDDALYDNLEDYFKTTLISSGVVSQDEAGDYLEDLMDSVGQYLVKNAAGEMEVVPANLLQMKVDDDSITIKGAENSTLANPDILKKQIVEYMKYRAPINCALSFFTGLESMGKSNEQSEVINSKITAEQQTSKVAKAAKDLYNELLNYDTTLYKYNDIVIGGDDTKDKTPSNDSARLADYTVRVRTGREGKNFETVNKYLLTYLLDDEIKDVRGNTSTAGSSLVSGDDPVTVGTKLKEAAEGLYNKEYVLHGEHVQNTITDFNNTKPQLRLDLSEEECKNRHLTDYDAAAKEYKAFFSYLYKAQQPGSDFLQLTQAYEEYLRAKDTMIKSLQKAQTNYNSLIDERDGLIEERATKQNRMENEIPAEISEKESKIAQNNTQIESLTTQLAAAKDSEKAGIQSQIDTLNQENETLNGEIAQLQEEAGRLQTEIDEIDGKLGPLQNKITEYVGQVNTTFINMAPAELFDGIRAALPKTDDKNHGLRWESIGSIGNTAEITKTAEVYDAYPNWVKLCKAYRKGANDYTDTLVKDLCDETSYVYTKVDTLNSTLLKIGITYNTGESYNGYVGELITQVQAYQTALKNWEEKNDTYAEDGEDQFSSNNQAEIDANMARYSIEQIKAVGDYATGEQQAVGTLYAYLSGVGFKYGSGRLDTLTKVEEAVNAVKSQAAVTTPGFKNKTAVPTAEEMKTAFDALLAAPTTEADPKNYKFQYTYTNDENKNTVPADRGGSTFYSFLKEHPLTGEPEILDFVGYLKCTFVAANQPTVTLKKEDGTAETGNAETLYNDMKTDLSKSDSIQESDTGVGGDEGSKSDKYGYTYYNYPTTPATGTSPVTENTSIDADDASGEYSERQNKVSSLLGGIGDALETGRDNIFVMEYIFSNFSYNTMVQDAAYAAEKDDTDSLLTFGTDKSVYAPYMAPTYEEQQKYASGEETDPYAKTRPKTLTGFPISGYNNRYYGAEVEYLLYGMETTKNNIVSADASIFALRFVMNSIFAFTDTEIRNMTRTAGLAVQAASVGVIPYQLVMVVLQLALAMAESGIDMDCMHRGVKIAIVPTKDTWLLSPSGAAGMLTDTAKAKAKEAVEVVATEALDAVNSGIQELVDAKAEDLKNYSNDYITALTETLSGKAYELLDQAFAEVEEAIMAGLNKMVSDPAYLQMTPQDALDQAFVEIQAVADSQLGKMEDSGDVGAAIASYVSGGVKDVVSSMKSKADTLLTQYVNTGKSPAEYLDTMVRSLQGELEGVVASKIGEIELLVREEAEKLIDEVDDQITELANQCTDEAKEKIISVTNDFIDNTVDGIADNLPSSFSASSATVKGDSALSAVLSFGYGDYLRVFLFLGLCGNDGKILERTAYLIESNINQPNEALKAKTETADEKNFWEELWGKITWFFTKKNTGGDGGGEAAPEVDTWEVEKSYTYIQIDADVDMEMLFLGSDIFKGIMTDSYTERGKETPDLSFSNRTFHYHSVMGY